MSETVAKKKFIQTNQQCYFDRTVWPAGEVFDCCYHPTEPVLACGLSTGIIRLFRLKNSTWTLEQEFQAETQSHISCLAYNVTYLNQHVSSEFDCPNSVFFFY